MPRVFTEIPQVADNIIRPVHMDIVRQVMKLTHLPKNTRILFPGATEEAQMPGSKLGGYQPSNVFPSDARVSIESSEDYTEDYAWTRTVMQKDTLPIFHDEVLGVRFAPIYVPTEVTLDVVYRAPNKVLAERFRDELRMRSAMLRTENLHEVTYHYALPDFMVELLKEVHRLREAVAPYGEDLLTYVGDNITQRATTLTTMIGTEPTLVIPETQTECQGWFDFSFSPEKAEKEGETGTWVIRFQYKTTYDKVIGIQADYPLVVHNQLISEYFRETPNVNGEQVDPNLRKRRPSASRHAMDHFVDCYPSVCKKWLDGVAIPVFDEWTPKHIAPDTSTLLAIMLSVDPDDKKAVLDLTDLGTWIIDPDVQAFMKTEAQHLFRYRESVIYISLYNENSPMQQSLLTIDSDLKIRCSQDLDLRKRYHLRIALLHDLTILSPDALQRFSQSGAAGLKILLTLQWKLFKRAVLPTLIGGTIIPKPFIREMGVAINDLKIPHSNGFEYHFLTVGNFLINALRMPNNADYERAPEAGDPTDARINGVTPDETTGSVYTVPGCVD